MNRDSNLYTFIFAAAMVVVVAASLAFTATSLKEKQQFNVKNEKMQNILATVGITVDRAQAQEKFGEYVKEQLSLTEDASIDENTSAFDINLAKELKKPSSEQRYPLFVANVEDKTYYVIPLRGSGLWDAIWGYVSLEDDLNTIKGVSFDHKGETAGLGGEITQDWFQERFVRETIFESNQFVGVTVLKGNSDPNNKDKKDHEVDAISGATITSDGVTAMIEERLTHYLPYFKNLRK